MINAEGNAVVMIGGRGYELPPLTFARLKKVYPILDEIRELGVDPEAEKELSPAERQELSNRRVEGMIRVVAHGLSKEHPELTASEIEDRLLASEVVALMTSFTDLLTVSGLTQSGEGKGPSEGVTASETATGSASINGAQAPERSAPSVH